MKWSKCPRELGHDLAQDQCSVLGDGVGSEGCTIVLFWGLSGFPQRHFGAFRGFAWVIRWESPCGSSWKTRSVFQGAGGRVLSVHGAVSFHRARPCATR